MGRSWLRLLVIVGACAGVLGVAGCGDDGNPLEPSVDETPLATGRFAFGVGCRVEGSPSVALRLGYSFDGQTGTLRTFDLLDLESGDEVRIDPTDRAEFADFVAMLTDGDDDILYARMEVTADAGGAIFVTTRPESVYWTERTDGGTGPDLAGANVRRIVVTFESVSIASPGSDPNGDGLWLEAGVTAVVRFY